MTGGTKVAHVPPGARGIRLGDKPVVSVVVASSRGVDVLAACLASLERQCREHQAEIVVASARRGSEIELLGERHPAIRWVTAEPHSDITQLRALGFAEARGDIVALTEDHDVVGPEWLGQRLRGAAPASPGSDAGGDGQREQTVDWAAYFARSEPHGRTPDPPASPGPARRS